MDDTSRLSRTKGLEGLFSGSSSKRSRSGGGYRNRRTNGAYGHNDREWSNDSYREARNDGDIGRFVNGSLDDMDSGLRRKNLKRNRERSNTRPSRDGSDSWDMPRSDQKIYRPRQRMVGKRFLTRHIKAQFRMFQKSPLKVLKKNPEEKEVAEEKKEDGMKKERKPKLLFTMQCKGLPADLPMPPSFEFIDKERRHPYRKELHGTMETFEVSCADPTKAEQIAFMRFFEWLQNNGNQRVLSFRLDPRGELHFLGQKGESSNSFKCAYKIPEGVRQEARRDVFAQNSHVSQNMQDPMPIRRLSELERILDCENAKTRKYQPRGLKEKKSAIHWGQRKLLLSEVEFLTEYAVEGATVLYVGAAPGIHSRYLPTMFPTLKFVLVDPAPFDEETIATENIVTMNQYFTDADCEKFKDIKDLLLVSDIRRDTYATKDQKKAEEAVIEDMRLQEGWHRDLRPIASMFKFRLPWPKQSGLDVFDYYDGKVYLPIWGRKSTSESRLVVMRDAEQKTWDNMKYEDQMYYFNHVTRLQYFEHPHEHPGEGIDHCFDCASEIRVIQQYLNSKWYAMSGKRFNVREMIEKFTEVCNFVEVDPRRKITLLSKETQKSPTFATYNQDDGEEPLLAAKRQRFNQKKARSDPPEHSNYNQHHDAPPHQ